MNRLRLFLSTAISISTLIASMAAASTTTTSNKVNWQAAVGSTPIVIDFRADDAGNPLPVFQYTPALTLHGVTFSNIYTYANQYIFSDRGTVMRIDLPANTNSFATDVLPGNNTVGGNYEIRLSTGETFSYPVTTNPSDFFGFVSTSAVQWIEMSLSTTELLMDNFYYAASVTQVGIDVLPEDPFNKVNPASNAYVTVGILSSSTFDARNIDFSTVRFGATGTEAGSRGSNLRDLNGDGRLDMLLYFPVAQTGITCTTSGVTLKGQTVAKQNITGSDSVAPTGCKPKR